MVIPVAAFTWQWG